MFAVGSHSISVKLPGSENDSLKYDATWNKDLLILSKPGFFWAPKTKGGAHCAPLAKTLLPFSESIQVTFFWKLVQKWISWHNFGFHGNHG